MAEVVVTVPPTYKEHVPVLIEALELVARAHPGENPVTVRSQSGEDEDVVATDLWRVSDGFCDAALPVLHEVTGTDTTIMSTTD